MVFHQVRSNPQMWEHRAKELLNRDPLADNVPPKAKDTDEDDYGAGSKDRKS